MISTSDQKMCKSVQKTKILDFYNKTLAEKARYLSSHTILEWGSGKFLFEGSNETRWIFKPTFKGYLVYGLICRGQQKGSKV